MHGNLPSTRSPSSASSTSTSSSTICAPPSPSFPVSQLYNTDAPPNDTQGQIPASSGGVTGNVTLDITAEISAYDSLAPQFNVVVLISTFAAALIISFLSLSHNVVKDSSSITFEIGMLLGFIALGFHLITALVAGRAGMLCFRLSKDIDVNQISFPKKSKASLKDFYNYLLLCEQLQLLGTGLFTPAAMYLLYFMFNHRGFSLAIYGIAVVAGYLIYRLGFWKASVLWENLEGCVKAVSCGLWGKRSGKGDDLEKGNGYGSSK